MDVGFLWVKASKVSHHSQTTSDTKRYGVYFEAQWNHSCTCSAGFGETSNEVWLGILQSCEFLEFLSSFIWQALLGTRRLDVVVWCPHEWNRVEWYSSPVRRNRKPGYNEDFGRFCVPFRIRIVCICVQCIITTVQPLHRIPMLGLELLTSNMMVSKFSSLGFDWDWREKGLSYRYSKRRYTVVESPSKLAHW